FPWAKREVQVQILLVQAVKRVRTDLHDQVEIARLTAIQAATSFARQAQALALGGTFRYPDPERSGHAMQQALGIVIGHGDTYIGFGAVIDLLKAYRQHHFEILTMQGPTSLTLPPAALRGCERGKKVCKIHVREVLRCFMEMLLPFAWRHEIFTLGTCAKRIVGSAFFRIFQGGVGFGHLLEFILCGVLLGYVGMVLMG